MIIEEPISSILITHMNKERGQAKKTMNDIREEHGKEECDWCDVEAFGVTWNEKTMRWENSDGEHIFPDDGTVEDTKDE